MENWKKINERIAYNGFRKIIVKKFLLPNGKEFDFDIIGENDFVTIAAFTHDKKALLVNQFRPGAERIMTSFPEGGVEEGENFELAARRELLEETGYEAAEIIFLKTIHRSYSTQKQHVVLAINCRKITTQNLDEGEDIEVVEMPLTEFRNFLKDKNNERMSHNIGPAYLALDYLNYI